MPKGHRDSLQFSSQFVIYEHQNGQDGPNEATAITHCTSDDYKYSTFSESGDEGVGLFLVWSLLSQAPLLHIWLRQIHTESLLACKITMKNLDVERSLDRGPETRRMDCGKGDRHPSVLGSMPHYVSERIA